MGEKAFITDLINRMTVKEKINQMRMCDIYSLYESIEKGDAPNVLCGCSYVTKNVPKAVVDRVQKYALKETRLGIPLIIMGESLHGSMYPGTTVFPQAIGLGAAFNTELMGEIVDIIAKETRSLGITQTYAPNLDLSRDPRWGRVEENYGEDPYLTAKLGVAYIKSLQKNGVAASPKHYVAHGSPEGGINLAPVHAGERELRDTMLIPFAAAFKEGGALSVMPAYSELDGVPIHASKFLLTEILRDELGFEGFVISDFGAVFMLKNFHNVAKTALEAGKMSLEAGLDIEAPNSFGFGEDFEKAAEAGEISIDLVNQAVERILRVKYRLGLFDDPYSREFEIHSEKSIEMARKTAHETVVMLKNEKCTLPLSNKIKKIALVGPNADSIQLGDYTHQAAVDYSVSLKQGLENRLGKDRVIFEKGCNIALGSDEMLKKAKKAAEEAEAVIVALGDNSNFYGGIGWGDKEGGGVVTCGEGFDVSALELPDCQKQLLKTCAESGKPIILVLITGRPYCINTESNLSNAILQAWYPGEQGGNALCDLIFGDVSPSARLPITIPFSTGHIPSFYNHKVSARGYYKKPGSPEKPGRDYVFADPKPLYEFGFGLSYSKFEYSNLQIDNKSTDENIDIKISVDVQNIGKMAAKETVLLFLRQTYCRITPFIKQLRGFKKISLEVGEKKTITFTLGFDDFSYINENMKPQVDKNGTFVVNIENLNREFTLG